MTGEKIWDYDKLGEGQAFVGRVESAKWESGDYGEQLHMVVKPLDHDVKGETGAYHEWFKYSDRKKSKWGEFIKLLGELGINMAKGEKELEGREFRFERRDIEFGKDAETGDTFKAEDVLLPVAIENGGKSGKKAKVDFTELDNKLKGDGMSTSQIEIWTKRNGIPKRDVNEHLTGLEESEKLEKTEDGTYYLK
ncbi:MAG: hypothetical protein KKB37_17330 [Alphaproteobacteria bacterium]|nr:hypothetical protein [Alphaproteobacteria bacterium]